MRTTRIKAAQATCLGRRLASAELAQRTCRPRSAALLRSLSRGVHAQGTGAEIHDLQQTAGEHDVLEEVNHLVLIREVSMKGKGRCQRKQGHHQRNGAGTVAAHEQCATPYFHQQRDDPRQLRQRQSDAADVCDRGVVCHELPQAAQEERGADHDSAEQREITIRLFHFSLQSVVVMCYAASTRIISAVSRAVMTIRVSHRIAMPSRSPTCWLFTMTRPRAGTR